MTEEALTLAVPTGRIFVSVMDLLKRAGLELPLDDVRARKLHIAAGNGASFLLVKDRDVPTYVEHGVADAGIVGTDVLAETAPDVYQPLDLGVGRCRMVVARKKLPQVTSYRELPLARVATKYPRVASRHFHRRGIPIEVIPLAGSVELAPTLGLADCVVDMVETGQTLAANDLVIDEVLFESTARLIVNRTSFRLKRVALDGLVGRLRAEVGS